MNTFQKIKSTKNLFTNINLLLIFIKSYKPNDTTIFFFINSNLVISIIKLFFYDDMLNIKNIV